MATVPLPRKKLRKPGRWVVVSAIRRDLEETNRVEGSDLLFCESGGDDAVTQSSRERGMG